MKKIIDSNTEMIETLEWSEQNREGMIKMLQWKTTNMPEIKRQKTRRLSKQKESFGKQMKCKKPNGNIKTVK